MPAAGRHHRPLRQHHRATDERDVPVPVPVSADPGIGTDLDPLVDDAANNDCSGSNDDASQQHRVTHARASLDPDVFAQIVAAAPR